MTRHLFRQSLTASSSWRTSERLAAAMVIVALCCMSPGRSMFVVRKTWVAQATARDLRTCIDECGKTVCGYPATPVNKAQQDEIKMLIDQTSSGSSFVLGGSRHVDVNNFRWVTGPYGKLDNGRGAIFFSGSKRDNGRCVPTMFCGFPLTEPNNDKNLEMDVVINRGGLWNDIHLAVNPADACVCQQSCDPTKSDERTRTSSVLSGTSDQSLSLSSPATLGTSGHTATIATSRSLSSSVSGTSAFTRSLRTSSNTVPSSTLDTLTATRTASRTLSILATSSLIPVDSTISSTVTFTSSHSASSSSSHSSTTTPTPTSHSASSSASHSSTTTPTPTMSTSTSRSVDLVIVPYTLPDAAKAAQATATSAAILSLGSGGDAATPTTLALLTTVNCEVRGGDGVMLTVAAKAVSVFGEYGFVAMGLINLVLLLGISGLHFIVVAAAARWGFGGESWLSVSGERGFRFPLLSVVLGEFLLPPAVFGAVAALVSSRSPTSLEATGAAVVLVVTALWVAGREAVVHRFILSHVQLHTYSADLVKYFLNARSSVLRVLLRPVLPILYWEPRALRISHGALFTRQRSFGSVKLGGCELWLALLTATLAVVAAVVDRAMCSVVTAVLGAAYLAFMLYCVAVRPFRLPHDAVIAPVTYFCFCVMCILKLIVPLVPSGVDISAIQTDTVIGVLLSVSMVLRSVLSVAMIVVERRVFDSVESNVCAAVNLKEFDAAQLGNHPETQFTDVLADNGCDTSDNDGGASPPSALHIPLLAHVSNVMSEPFRTLAVDRCANNENVDVQVDPYDYYLALASDT